MSFKQKLMIVGIAGMVVLLLDQGTKIWARSALLTQTQRRALFDENPEMYRGGEILKTPKGKRYRVHPQDPTRGKRKVKPVKRDGKKTFVKAMGDRPGARMWFILSFNPGAAFGLFNDTAGSRVFLSIIGLLALALIFYLLRRPESDSKLFVWALAMVAGGAVGNLIDRIFYGVVTDFIWVWLTPGWRLVWPWPAFNIADIALVVGVGLMVPAMLFAKSDQDEEGARDGAAKEDDGKPGGDTSDSAKTTPKSGAKASTKSGTKSKRRSRKGSSKRK
jgi:lipoprotein signal peptidase